MGIRLLRKGHRSPQEAFAGSRKDIARITKAASRCSVRRATVVCLVRYEDRSFCTVNLKGPGAVSPRTKHAEEIAYHRIRRMQIHGHLEVYVMRLAHDGTFANSRPCGGCARLMETLSGQGHSIFYTNHRGHFVPWRSPRGYGTLTF